MCLSLRLHKSKVHSRLRVPTCGVHLPTAHNEVPWEQLIEKCTLLITPQHKGGKVECI